MGISVRYLHNYMIKPSDNGGLASVVYSVTQKLLIIDTTLRLFIIQKVRKMTPKLRQICGCELCIITNYVYIDLNIFRRILVKYLQQKYVERHIFNSLFSTKIAAYYKDKVLPDSEFLHATIKYSAKYITCFPIKPNNMIHIKCDLGFLMNFLSTIFLMKKYMMDQMIQ